MKALSFHLVIMGIFLGAASFSDHRNKTAYHGTESQFIITFTDQPNIDGNSLKDSLAVRKANGYCFVIKSTEVEQEKLSQFLRISLSCPAEGTFASSRKTGMKTVSITSVIFSAKAPIGYSKRIPFHFKNAK
ncbi:hypothetical protein KEH51_16845 [[Brevibacterium] frigoritolerans]|uniref:Uncharacterized protein n=1 Tax=Peribacillus frigoritolerans TaxID=450367 RepID=A0A941FPG0_9BACI|nr:hypothetical protein [Peribacillus frigoritolerans]